MSLDEAVRRDRAGDFRAAIELYEAALREGRADLTTLLDLAILLWVTTDPGFVAYHDFSAAFMNAASRRARALLDEAARRFPGSGEVRFWRRYVDWADLGEPFDPKACRALLAGEPPSQVPAFCLFGWSEGEAYRDEAAALLAWCDRHGTERARYIASVIRGVQGRRGE